MLCMLCYVMYVGLYILVELSLLATFVGGSENPRVRKFQGAKVPHLVLSLPGANGLGSEKSIIRFNPLKSQVITFGGRPPQSAMITMGDSTVPLVNRVKYLGLVLLR